MPGNGIEPLSKDFQSNALPLSYPVEYNIFFTRNIRITYKIN